MGSPLEALPVELIEHIVTVLEFSDIAALRLTSRAIEAKASNGRFNSFLKTKKIDLTTKTLQRFVKATGKGQRGCLLQHCTITGIIRGDTPAHEDSTEHERLLTKAFRNLKQGSPEKSLASLSLRVTVRVEDSNGDLVEPHEYRNGREVWRAALRTFRVAMAALHESQLPVNEHLDIFGGAKGCSLGCDAFLAEFAPESASRGEIFRSLKTLTARLSAPPNLDEVASEHASECESDSIAEYKARQPPLAQSGWQADRVLGEILNVLPTVPELKSLDLHWYMLKENNDPAPSVPAATTLHGSGTSPGFPHLKECRLRGVYASETNLLHFLSALRPTEVKLTYIRLTSGAYTPVFQYLTSEDSPVTSYHLDDVHEGRKLVHFVVPGPPKFPYLGRPDIGPSTLSREGGQVKEAIQYRFTRKRPLGSPQRTRWGRFKAQEFGGNCGGPYDFVVLNKQPEKIPFWANTNDD
jgi:hypothetical protein